MTTIVRMQFGNPILRRKARRITVSRITSGRIQTLIAEMKHTLAKEKLGVALAAPQVGYSLALVVVAARPLPHRPMSSRLTWCSSTLKLSNTAEAAKACGKAA